MGRLETERGDAFSTPSIKAISTIQYCVPSSCFHLKRQKKKNERISYKDALSAAILYCSNESGCSWQIFEYWTTSPDLNVQGSRFQGPR